MKRFVFWVLWLGFILYAFILAPPDRPDTADLILRLSTGAWDGINPFVIALFSTMGIWPLAYAAVALAVFALLNGDWLDFWHQWQTSRFMHIEGSSCSISFPWIE